MIYSEAEILEWLYSSILYQRDYIKLPNGGILPLIYKKDRIEVNLIDTATGEEGKIEKGVKRIAFRLERISEDELKTEEVIKA